MGGLLIPSWYRAEDPTRLSFALVTFFFGFSTACAAFTAVNILAQAHRTWKRSHRLLTHPYIAMIVTEWVSSAVISVICYLFVLDVIPPSFWLFFAILCLWVLQIQCIMHIIINRIALIMCDQRRVRKLTWVVALLIGAINISVFIIWMPARLQISAGWIHLNNIWDRIEKGIFLLIDLGLNLYFIHLVRAELICHGLTKYWNLYWFNVGMIFISISLDILLIGIMSLPSQPTVIYIQFHPLMYLVKLKIEMNMADLIIKIVKASTPAQGHELHRYAEPAFVGHQGTSSATRSRRPNRPAQPSRSPSDASTHTRESTSTTLQTNVSAQAAGSTSPAKRNYRCSSKGREQQQQHRQREGQDSVLQGWELTRMSSNFDPSDVVDTRKGSMAQANSVKMVPLATLFRPLLRRQMSEITELEVELGYLDPHTRDTRKSGPIEQSPT